MHSHRLKVFTLLNHFLSERVSIKSPTSTNMPPMQADKMKPKLDVVVVSIYAAMGIVDCGSD